MAIANYQIILAQPNKLVVKVNPIAYAVSVVRKQVPTGFIAFNTNYFGPLGIPIGRLTKTYTDGGLKTHTSTYFSYQSKYNRPIFRVKGVECEVGPILVCAGMNYVDNGIKEGGFKPGAIRRTDHVGVGYTNSGKLVIVYMRNCSMHELAKELMQHGCIDGYKMDGGHSAYLKVGSVVYKHKDNKSGRITVGVQFS